MRIKLTSRNRLTLPRSVSAAFKGVTYFEVTAENGRIVLTPARPSQADAVRARLADLNLSDADVTAAVAWHGRLRASWRIWNGKDTMTGQPQFTPDYAVSPGCVLEERLHAYDFSQAEVARRCGCAPKLISAIIAGEARLEAKTALQFEKVLGVDARIWLGMEADYQLARARRHLAGD